MIYPLEDNVRSQLRSGVAITSISQCVEELVLNSVDAGASCVSVCVDISMFRVQVTDNGSGITKCDLERVGHRYCTSKCHSLNDLKTLKCYGYRGEALASLLEISGVLEIVTRHRSSYKTLCSTFVNGKSVGVSESCIPRTNVGTTITVHDLFSSLPVRRKVISEMLEFERIRQRVAAIALIHPTISLSLRNDATQTKCLQTHKSQSLRSTFTQLYGSLKSKGLREIHHIHKIKQLELEGSISVDTHHNKNLQFIYINSRLVLKTKIHKLVGNILSKSAILKSLALPVDCESRGKTCIESPDKYSDKYGIFVINIKCPLDEYDITLEPSKTLVEFQDWDGVLECVEECVQSFLMRENLVPKASESDFPQSDEGKSVENLADKTTESKGNLSMYQYRNTNSCADKADSLQISTSSFSKSLHSSVVYRRKKVACTGNNIVENNSTESRCNHTDMEYENVDEKTVGLDDQSNAAAQSNHQLSDTLTSIDGDHSSEGLKPIIPAVDSSGPVQNVLTNENNKISELTNKSQIGNETLNEKVPLSESLKEENVVCPALGRKHAIIESVSEETYSEIGEKPICTQRKANAVQSPSVSSDFKEKLIRLKYDYGKNSDELGSSNMQEKSSLRQYSKTDNQSEFRGQLKQSSENASNSSVSFIKSVQLRSGSSFSSPNPITLQGLQSRKRYSKAANDLNRDQTDSNGIPMKAKKKILLPRDRNRSFSGVSKIRGQSKSNGSNILNIKNANSSNECETVQEAPSSIAGNFQVDKSRNTFLLPMLTSATHTCSSGARTTSCLSVSRSSSSICHSAPNATTSIAETCCGKDDLHNCHMNSRGFPSNESCVTSFNKSGKDLHCVSIPSSHVLEKRVSEEIPTLERENESSSVSMSEMSLLMEGVCSDSENISEHECRATVASIVSETDAHNLNFQTEITREPIPRTVVGHEVTEHSVLSMDTICDKDTRDNKIVTKHSEIEWLHTFDPACGKKIYVNSRTGNCSFQTPLGVGNEWENEEERYRQHQPHPLVPHLSFNCSPWLPRADRNKNKQTRNILVTDAQVSLSEIMCEEQTQSFGTDKYCKWKNLDTAEGGSQNVFDETVSNMLELWENPIFEPPEKEIVNLNKARCGKNEVLVHNVVFPYRFTKCMLSRVQVIKQVDNKFIVCLLSSEEHSESHETDENGLLVLVDQHAAHERVRLEQLQADLYEQDDSKISIKSSPIFPAMEILFTQDEVRLLTSYRAEFRCIGIQFEAPEEFNTTSDREVLVKLVGLPSVFVERELSEVKRGRPSVAHGIVKGLIKEHLEKLSSTGSVLATIPKTILRVLNSQACHGAVKFGEPLTVVDCEKLMESLAKCSLPFQCAHGRPSIVPLVDLKLIEKKYKQEQGNHQETRLRDWAQKQRLVAK